jgi:aryl-alcohol dehydrogenase-like predicted oxidoreductase
LALAWLLTRPDVIPIPGTSRKDRLEENVRAVDISLMDSEIAQIEDAVPKGAAAGKRYGPEMLDLVNG